MTDRAVIPNPGSPEAVEQGCLCPVIDNHYGKGIEMERGPSPIFTFNMECPLHGDGDWLGEDDE